MKAKMKFPDGVWRFLHMLGCTFPKTRAPSFQSRSAPPQNKEKAYKKGKRQIWKEQKNVKWDYMRSDLINIKLFLKDDRKEDINPGSFMSLYMPTTVRF